MEIIKADNSWQNETVSNATLRDPDLAGAFLGALESIDPARAALWASEAALALITCNWDGDRLNTADTVSEILVELQDLLNERAPEGYHFGSIEGDGACFGFWENEPEDD